MKQNTKNVCVFGLCVALAVILAYVEVLLPPVSYAAPGIKMGLPNIIVVFLLYKKGIVPAITVSFVRIILISLLFGSVMSLAYSIVGGILSILSMTLLKRFCVFSVVGVSVIGAVLHNLGQILVACIVFETASLGYYMLLLTFTGTVAGICIGLIGALLIKKIPDKILS